MTIGVDWQGVVMDERLLKRTDRSLALTLIVNALFFVVGLLALSRLGIDDIRDWIQSFGALGPAVYFAVYLGLFIIPFNPIPKNVVAAMALVGFGPLVALVVTLAADVAGILFNYRMGAHFHRLLPAKRREYFTRLAEKRGWWVLAVSRVLPITEGYAGADLPSYAAGVVKMPLQPFFLATMVPWLVIDAIYFYGLHVILAHRLLIPALIAVFVLPIATVVIRRRHV